MVVGLGLSTLQQAYCAAIGPEPAGLQATERGRRWSVWLAASRQDSVCTKAGRGALKLFGILPVEGAKGSPSALENLYEHLTDTHRPDVGLGFVRPRQAETRYLCSPWEQCTSHGEWTSAGLVRAVSCSLLFLLFLPLRLFIQSPSASSFIVLFRVCFMVHGLLLQNGPPRKAVL